MPDQGQAAPPTVFALPPPVCVAAVLTLAGSSSSVPWKCRITVFRDSKRFCKFLGLGCLHEICHLICAKHDLAMEWHIPPPQHTHTGVLLDHVGYEHINVENLKANLIIHAIHKRPYRSRCSGCQNQRTLVKSWGLLSQQMSLCRGGHTFQFSALLESQLPASVDTPVYRIMYEFEAELCVVQSCRTSASMYKFSRTLTAKRSLPQPLYLHHTLRVFPPTNIIADVNYNKVVYPNASNDLTLKLDGLKTENKHPRTAELWKLKTIAWRLVETTKTISPACVKHAHTGFKALKGVDNEPARGVTRTGTRVIGSELLCEGWKSDVSIDGNTAHVVLRFCANSPATRNSRNDSRAQVCLQFQGNRRHRGQSLAEG